MSTDIKTHMAVVTLGVGDYSQLSYKPVTTPLDMVPGKELIKVLSCGLNNTDLNTRVGWYSKDADNPTGYGGDKPSPFPLIQGTDGFGITSGGQRVLVRSSTPRGWYGSDFSGFFQQYCEVDSRDVFPVPDGCKLSEAQLGTIPCIYGTAENMLLRASVREGDRVIVPGASGGVAGAVIELCLARGCNVVGMTSSEVKAQNLRER